MRRRGGTIGTVAIALALLLAACGGDDSSAASDDTTTSTTAADATTSTEAVDVAPTLPEHTATSLGTVPDQLPDGHYFGYITELHRGGVGFIAKFDLAELLTGQAAVDAATAAGEQPLDFYIKNESEKLRTVDVAPAVAVKDIDYDDCCEAKTVTLQEFIDNRDAAGEERTAVDIWVSEGFIISLHEVYFP